MQAKLLKTKGTWRDVADAANVTIGKEAGDKEPSSSWKRRMLLCEHSPIRLLVFDVLLTGIKSWVSVHLTRHKIGIEHFVRSQRTDRTGVDRDSLPQDALVDHQITVNAQALINISRRRMCYKASKETMAAWMRVVAAIGEVEPEIGNLCVPDCIYRGRCYEFIPCGFDKTKTFAEWLETYRRER